MAVSPDPFVMKGCGETNAIYTFAYVIGLGFLSFNYSCYCCYIQVCLTYKTKSSYRVDNVKGSNKN